MPVGLQAFQSCGGLRLPVRMDLSTTLQRLGLVAEANLEAFPHNRSQDAAPAPPQPRLPGAPPPWCFALFDAWVALALWDLARRDDLGRGATIAWVAVVLVVAFLGVIAYHALGRPKIRAGRAPP